MNNHVNERKRKYFLRKSKNGKSNKSMKGKDAPSCNSVHLIWGSLKYTLNLKTKTPQEEITRKKKQKLKLKWKFLKWDCVVIHHCLKARTFLPSFSIVFSATLPFSVFFFPECFPRKFWPQSTLSFLFDKLGNDRKSLHKLCMNRSADREATGRTNFENYSLCKPCLMYCLLHVLLPLLLLLFCFPLFLLPCFPCCRRSKTLRLRKRSHKPFLWSVRLCGSETSLWLRSPWPPSARPGSPSPIFSGNLQAPLLYW